MLSTLSENKIDEITLGFLHKEASIASINLCSGMTGLKSASNTRKGIYYQAFFGLSIGLERLLKLLFLLNYRSQKERFPDNRELKKLGHKIHEIFEKISKEFTTIEGNQILQNDLIYSNILKFLENFADQSRYANLDYLSGKKTVNDPIVLWYQKIGREIINRHFKGINENLIKFAIKMDKITFVRSTDEEGHIISNMTDSMFKSKQGETIRKYSAVYVGDIIRYLIRILNEIESKFNPPLSLHEFFILFDQPRKFYLRKKIWNPYKL